MVLCINAGAKVTLFIGSTTLFPNLLSCEVMIFNKWGAVFLGFTVRSFGLRPSLLSFSFFVFFPFFPYFLCFALHASRSALFVLASKKFFFLSPFYYLCTVFINKIIYV